MRSLERIVALLLWYSSVCLSVCLSETSVHCDHTVYFNAGLSLRLHSNVTPKDVHLLATVFFEFHQESRGMDLQARRTIKR